MPPFERTVNCAGTCDLFRTRKEQRNIENLLKKRIGKRGGTMCSRVSEILHQFGAIPPDMSVYAVLGQGEYGTVLGVCESGSTRSTKMALKITTDSKHARWEIEMQHKFHAIGLAPPVHNVTHFGGNTFILMGHIDMTLEEYLLNNKNTISTRELERIFDEIEDAVDTMYEYNISHGDMHTENMAVILDDSGSYTGITLIDFGFSSLRDGTNIITKELQVFREYLQLLRSSSCLENLTCETRNVILRRLNRSDMIETRKTFQVGDDLENNETTQDDTFALVHEFFEDNAIWK